ncbi:MAG: D-alanine--D-alanine ligase [Lachnospiraceae bacterium]|nr:D-alanine--D-alanine ligase [Lachnospiraceae bacterium]
MKVVVLCGGLSSERDISLSSGTQICTALRKNGHRAVLVDLFLGLEDKGDEVLADPSVLFEDLPALDPIVFTGKEPDLNAVKNSRKWKDESLFGRGVLEICKAADMVFMALHGMNGEDGRVQAAFDMMGIRYTGSGYLGSAMSMDKMLTKERLTPYGIPMPKWISLRNQTEEDIPAIEKTVREWLPCVVKTPTGGSSLGVFIVREEGQIKEAVKNCLSFGKDVLIEEFIEGKELTCGVLKGRALPSVEIIPKVRFYDYSNKYMAGATEEICPGRIKPETEKTIGEIALKVQEIMGLHTYSRSDFVVDQEEKVYFLEVNTLPGMTPTSLVPQEAAAVGISFEELCEIILQDGMTRD